MMLTKWIRSGLGILRDRDRSVLITPPAIGLGNFLYLWLQADIRKRRGEYCKVISTPDMEGWLTHLPTMRDLVIEPQAVGFMQHRERDGFQNYGSEFRRKDLDAFIQERILAIPHIKTGIEEHHAPRTLALNIRRGDFYSVPEHRGNYSFDVVEYIRTALLTAPVAEREFDRIEVVSDDPAWCSLKLAWLESRTDEVEWVGLESPLQHFTRLSSANCLVLTNSTFGYWAGYTATSFFSGRNAVIAPWFHARNILGGQAFQLDPQWTVVDSIPGGWDG